MTRLKSVISVDARMLRASGIGTCIRHVLIQMHTLGYPIVALCYEKDREGLSKYVNDTILVKSPIYSIQEQLELAAKIPKETIFWSPHYNVPMLPIRAKKRIVTIHDIYHKAFANEFSLKQKVYSHYVIKRALKISDKVITSSEFSKSEMIRYYGNLGKKAHVIPLGVDKEVFKAVSDNAVKIKYSLPDHYILALGNLKKNKNFPKLLEAYFQFLERGHLSWKLVIAGKSEGLLNSDGGIKELLAKKPQWREYVYCPGFIEDADLPALYSMASLFVFPSVYEGFGLPPLEAMSCGCPVLASNAASVPEVCGDSAYYINPYSEKSIADGLEKVLCSFNMGAELKNKGLEHVKQFNWLSTALEMEKLIEAL